MIILMRIFLSIKYLYRNVFSNTMNIPKSFKAELTKRERREEKKRLEEIKEEESYRQKLQKHEESQIHLYLSTKLLEKRKCIVPDGIAVRKITDYEQSLLKILKYDIYKARGGEMKSPLLEILRELKNCE